MSLDSSEASARHLVFRENGNPAKVLELASFTPTAPNPGEVRVRLLAAPINPADLNTVEGTYGEKLELPAVPGIEGCGVVEASAADGFAEGDQVIFVHRAGTWASHTTVPASTLFRLPAGIDPIQAALLKVNPATAWRLLRGFRPLEQGDWIAQNAGNSAVSRCVIQLARDLGIRTISFVRRRELFDELIALGADHVFLDDDDGPVAAREAMGGAKAPLVFNSVGGDSSTRLMKLLCEGGIHITYGAMGRKPVTVSNGLLIFKDIQVRGLWVSRWIKNAPREEVDALYEALAERVVSGRLTQSVDSTFTLEKIRDALERLEAPGRSGKVLLVP